MIIHFHNLILSNRFEEGTDIAKAVYQKYIPKGGAVADVEYTDIPCFENGRVYMYFANDAVNIRGAGTTYFHEHGHYLDDKAGYISHSAILRH